MKIRSIHLGDDGPESVEVQMTITDVARLWEMLGNSHLEPSVIPQAPDAEMYAAVSSVLNDYWDDGHEAINALVIAHAAEPVPAEWGVRFHAGDEPVEMASETEARRWLSMQGCPPPLMRRVNGQWVYVDGPPLWGFLAYTGHVWEFANEAAARRWAEIGGFKGIVIHRADQGEPWLQDNAEESK